MCRVPVCFVGFIETPVVFSSTKLIHEFGVHLHLHDGDVPVPGAECWSLCQTRDVLDSSDWLVWIFNSRWLIILVVREDFVLLVLSCCVPAGVTTWGSCDGGWRASCSTEEARTRSLLPVPCHWQCALKNRNHHDGARVRNYSTSTRQK